MMLRHGRRFAPLAAMALLGAALGAATSGAWAAPQAAPLAAPADDPVCTVAPDKTAAPAEIPLGASVTVTLKLDGSCPTKLVPADVILVIDRSGSMVRDGKIEAAKAAAVGFVNRTDPAQTRVGLVAIAGVATRVMALTDDRPALVAAINDLTIDAGTNLVDGLAEGRRALSGGDVRPDANRFIVFLTDGRHTVPQPPASELDRVISQVRADGIIVYSIGLGNDLDERVLKRMATSPTHYYFSPSSADLERIYLEIARRIEAQVLFQSLRITDVVPANMTYLPGTGRPVEPDVSTDGKTLTWQLADLPAPGLALTYQLRPEEPGTWPTNVEARAEFRDGFGNDGKLVFPVPTVRVLAPTPTPAPPTATPPPGAGCVCTIVRFRVPPEVIADALAHPEQYYGWEYELDKGKPPSPANPPRLCLTLWNVNIDYHPLFNKPRWRVGCP
jgi:hypothetical protein